MLYKLYRMAYFLCLFVLASAYTIWHTFNKLVLFLIMKIKLLTMDSDAGSITSMKKLLIILSALAVLGLSTAGILHEVQHSASLTDQDHASCPICQFVLNGFITAVVYFVLKHFLQSAYCYFSKSSIPTEEVFYQSIAVRAPPSIA